MALNDCIVLPAAYPKGWFSIAEPQTTRLEWHGYIPARMATLIVGSAIGWCPHEPALKRPCEVVRMLGRDLGCPFFSAGEDCRRPKWENMKSMNSAKKKGGL